jgi:hypothetical protein
LTENQLESSIHFSLFFTILFWLDWNIKLKIKQFANKFFVD